MQDGNEQFSKLVLGPIFLTAGTTREKQEVIFARVDYIINGIEDITIHVSKTIPDDMERYFCTCINAEIIINKCIMVLSADKAQKEQQPTAASLPSCRSLYLIPF